MEPTIGKAILYQMLKNEDYKGAEVYAGFIAAIYRVTPYEFDNSGKPLVSNEVDVFLMTSRGGTGVQKVPYSTEQKPGHWFWPTNV